SGRAVCTACGSLVARGMLRIRVTDPPRGRGATRFLHVVCASGQLPAGVVAEPGQRVGGWAGLVRAERECVARVLRGLPPRPGLGSVRLIG
ncbi:hypothetical protein HK405_014701, partial [Cladochytrium tenue]